MSFWGVKNRKTRNSLKMVLNLYIKQQPRTQRGFSFACYTVFILVEPIRFELMTPCLQIILFAQTFTPIYTLFIPCLTAETRPTHNFGRHFVDTLTRHILRGFGYSSVTAAASARGTLVGQTSALI